MDFCGGGGLNDTTSIAAVDTATRQNDDSAGGLLHQLTQERDAGLGRGGLTGSEDTGTTKVDELFQGILRPVAAVESPVEGDGTAISSSHPAAGGFEVDIAARRKGTHNDAIGPGTNGGTNVTLHQRHLLGRIDEGTFDRSDQDMDAEVGVTLADGLKQSDAGREAIQRESLAQLYAPRATKNGLTYAVEGAATHLEERGEAPYAPPMGGARL